MSPKQQRELDMIFEDWVPGNEDNTFLAEVLVQGSATKFVITLKEDMWTVSSAGSTCTDKYLSHAATVVGNMINGSRQIAEAEDKRVMDEITKTNAVK